MPQVIGYALDDYDRTRMNGQLTLQFRPVESLTATLDYTYAEFELDRTFNNLSAWFNFGGQETAWTDGPQAAATEYTENSLNSDFAMGAGADSFRNELDSLGLNLEWDVSDRLSLSLDYHNSTASNEPNSPYGSAAQLAISAFSRDRTSGYFGPELPVPRARPEQPAVHGRHDRDRQRVRLGPVRDGHRPSLARRQLRL